MVSIKLIIDKGMITFANISKEETIIAGEKEKITLAYDEYEMSKINNPKYTMQEALNSEKVEAIAEGDETLGWNITFEGTNHQYSLNLDGTIEEGIPDRWDGKNKETPQIAEDNSWHIYNSAQMKYFADFVNGNLTEEEKGNLSITADTTVYLEANLDLGARANEEGEKIVGTEWTPVGETTAKKFIGIFEGNNHYISGVYVNKNSDYGGIFGLVSNNVQNLTIKNSYIKAKERAAGIIGGLLAGKVENCHNINTTIISETSYAGGVVSVVNTETQILRCTNSGIVKVTGQYVGGIAAALVKNSNISDCINNGEIIGENGYIGGIAGMISSSCNISNCRNNGKVTGKGREIGGIIGYANRLANIENCYNVAIIEGQGSRLGGIAGTAGSVKKCSNSGKIYGENYCVGGCIGILFGTATNCSNQGEVIAKKTGGSTFEGIGGVIGEIGKGESSEITVNVSNCYNSGNVKSEIRTTGGIIGWAASSNLKGTIVNNYNSGNIEGTTEVGGIIGRNKETFDTQNCYNSGNVIGTNMVGAVIGNQQTSTEKLSKLYYLNTISLPAIGNMEAPSTVESVEENLNSFEEFLSWIQSK